jgi:hypothetical protein
VGERTAKEEPSEPTTNTSNTAYLATKPGKNKKKHQILYEKKSQNSKADKETSASPKIRKK